MGYRKNGNKRELDECPACSSSRLTERSRLTPKYRCSDCKECFNKPRVKKWTVKEKIVSVCPRCFGASITTRGGRATRFRCNNCGNQFDVPANRPAVPRGICRPCGALWLATFARSERACDTHREQLKAELDAKSGELSERKKCCCCVLGREHERAPHAEPPPKPVCRHHCTACSTGQACVAHCTLCGCRKSGVGHLHCAFCPAVAMFSDSPKGETYACEEFVCHHCFHKDRDSGLAWLKTHGYASDDVGIAEHEKTMAMMNAKSKDKP